MQAVLANLNAINLRLTSLEKATAPPARPDPQAGLLPPPAVVHPAAQQPAVPTAPVPAAAPFQPPLYSLASAVSSTGQGRAYIPQAANVSPRLRAKIIQGKDINLISLLLTSPVCDKKIAEGDQFTAIVKASDPRLSRDLSIGEFLVAFGIYRDVMCSVYPQRRQELDILYIWH